MQILSLIILEVARFLAALGIPGVYAPLVALILVYLFSTALIVVPLFLYVLRRRQRESGHRAPRPPQES